MLGSWVQVPPVSLATLEVKRGLFSRVFLCAVQGPEGLGRSQCPKQYLGKVLNLRLLTFGRSPLGDLAKPFRLQEERDWRGERVLLGQSFE